MVVLVGCVIRTEHRIDAHITLDIRHVEQEVAGVFDFVEGKREELPDIQAPPAPAETGSPSGRLYNQVLDFLQPMRPVYAETTSPVIEETAKSMKARYAKLSEWKAKGGLGENNRGYVELRDCPEFSEAAKKNAAQQLLAEENKDRKTFYREFARPQEHHRLHHGIGRCERPVEARQIGRSRSTSRSRSGL